MERGGPRPGKLLHAGVSNSEPTLQSLLARWASPKIGVYNVSFEVIRKGRGRWKFEEGHSKPTRGACIVGNKETKLTVVDKRRAWATIIQSQQRLQRY